MKYVGIYLNIQSILFIMLLLHSIYYIITYIIILWSILVLHRWLQRNLGYISDLIKNSRIYSELASTGVLSYPSFVLLSSRHINNKRFINSRVQWNFIALNFSWTLLTHSDLYILFHVNVLSLAQSEYEFSLILIGAKFSCKVNQKRDIMSYDEVDYNEVRCIYI